MTRVASTVGSIAVLAAVACSAPGSGPAGVFDEVVAAERAFAATSRTEGMRAAFLANLAERSVLFRPGPVDGRSVYAEPLGPPGTLDWYPARCGVAVSGDLAFSTGPFEYRNDEAPVSQGHFFSVWQRQAEGVWRVVLDAGIGHALASDWTPKATPRQSPAGTKTSAASPSPEEADSALATAWKTRGNVAAHREVAASDFTVYRDGFPPAEGKSGYTLLGADPEHLVAARTDGSGRSGAGDLAYTYGTLQTHDGGTARTYAYVRAWRYIPEGYRLVIDLRTAIPLADAG